ncbi:MAG: sensor histidine kinase [Hespellia sp.]|nr:sensor histidine kinase [Hespellia sp.]
MKKKWSLSTKLTLSYVILIIFILTMSLIYLLRMQTTNITELVDSTISGLSYTLSIDPSIITAVENQNFTEKERTYLDDLNVQKDYVDYIVIVDMEDIRLYHTDSDKIGLHFQGGDETKALAGSSTYITEGKGTREYQRRAFSTIYDGHGQPIGFVMVSSYTKSISYIKRQEISKYLIIFAVAMLLGIAFAFFIARNVRKSLLGYEPTQISRLFLQREEILGTLTEGLLLINTNGECEYSNPSARKLFPGEDISSQNLAIQEFIEQYLRADLLSKDELCHYQLQLDDATLLMDKIPIIDQKKVIGILVLLNDKTETTKMAEELTGVNHIIAALRATTHEHKNKLHVILGLLQTGDTKEAMTYINDCALEEEDNSQVLNCIKNKTIAALILGKKNRAKELNITFNLLKGSFLEAHNDYLSATDLVTIIGNLIENAFDALTHVEETREVNLFIESGKDALLIIVDDTGDGMDEDTIRTLLQGPYTTKGSGHGVGLTLIRNIVTRCEGILDIESERGEGSSFSITIKKKRVHHIQEETSI